MKKSTGWLLFGLGVAVTAAGAYYVYKNQDKFVKTEEVVDADGTTHTKRTYLSLDVDNAKAKVNETLAKTKEMAQETWKKVEGKIEEAKAPKDVASEDLEDDFDVTAEEAVNTAEMNAEAAAEELVEAVEILTDDTVVSEEISDFATEE